MKVPLYFLITNPITGDSWTCVGGPLKRSDNPGHVWLTSFQTGERLLEVPREWVRPSSPQELSERLAGDVRNIRAALAAMN